MEQKQETTTLNLGQIGYEAYRQHTGGISLATGQQLPTYDELNDQVRGAWNKAGAQIGMAIVEELKRAAAATGGEVTVNLAGDFSAVLEAEDPEPEHPTPEQKITPVQKPSIGRIVIYHGSIDRPAIVVAVHSPVQVDLVVFQCDYHHPAFYETFVLFGSCQGKWSWPERVA